jgi:hypothetical protein
MVSPLVTVAVSVFQLSGEDGEVFVIENRIL